MAQTDTHPTRTLRILAIDDDPLMLQVYRKILPEEPTTPPPTLEGEMPYALQYLLDQQESGKEALLQLQQAMEQGDPYGLVYLDMRMPGMSGMEVAKRIRTLDPTVMIILITAYEDHDLVEARRELGSNFEFFSKPVDPAELLNLTGIFARHWYRTMELLQQRQTCCPPAPPPPVHSAEQTRVMFVDDSATVRAVYSDLLRADPRYAVAVAGSLEEAVELANQFIPDISILDYYMPGGNGDELARRLLKNERTKNTLILVLTQREEVEEIMLNVGAVDILYKDDPTKVFLQRVGAMERYIRTQMDLRSSIETQTRIANEQEKSLIQAKEARLRRNWLESIISSIPVSLLVLDQKRIIRQVNPAAIHLMGYSNEGLIGMHIDRLVENEEEQEEFDCRVRCENGSTIPVTISQASLAPPESDPPGEVMIIYDLRERIAMEQERATQANQLAYQSGLSEMSSNVLHNIGNTIGGMSWQVIALEKSLRRLLSIQQGLQGGLSIDKIERLHAGLEHALEDLDLLNREGFATQIKDIGKSIEYVGEVIRIQQSVAQVQSLYMRSFTLGEAIEDVLLIERETNRKHNVVVQYQIEPSLSQVSLPYNQFMQLLGNLIKNSREAIQEKRAELESPEHPGEINIDIAPSRAGRFVLTISDNGCGIQKDRLESIFLRGESSKQQGSGFGLHSAATFIQSLQGSIHALSPGEGQGASIVLELPTEAKTVSVSQRKPRREQT